jgi:hypothetical protein
MRPQPARADSFRGDRRHSPSAQLVSRRKSTRRAVLRGSRRLSSTGSIARAGQARAMAMSFCGPAEGTELLSRSRFCARPERDAYLVVARLTFERSPVSVARNTGSRDSRTAVNHRRLDLDEALAPIALHGHRAAPLGSLDHIRRNTTLRLLAGISVITGAENPTDCAIAATASRSRRPQRGLRSRRLRSNAWLLWPLRTLRVCMDHRDRTATPEGVSQRPL